IGLIVLARTGDALVDWLWFSSLGYADVFWTIFVTRSAVFFVSLCLSATTIGLSGWLALRYAQPLTAMTPPPPPPRGSLSSPPPPRPGGSLGGPRPSPPGLPQSAARLPWRLLVAGAPLALALLAAGVAVGGWDTVLRLIYAVRAGQADPVFGNDLGFYFFSLP